MKITTKTGDKGETSLFGGRPACPAGRRVSKASNFIELVGELDELQAVIGWCWASANSADLDFRDVPKITDQNLSKILHRVMDDIYRMMAIVGFELKCPKNIKQISQEDVEFLEGVMKGYENAVGNLNKFVRPGGSEISARLHIARTLCRRVERRVVGMMEYNLNGVSREVLGQILKYLNRLSDLLFILAYESEKL